jgi:hypothetical protein
MSIPENDTQLWKGFDGHGLYAKRTERDREGVIIDEAYARKSELHPLENALSDSTTTELTPAAAKSAIDALRKAPTPGNEGTMLSYGVSQNAMAWESWEDEQMDIPVAGAGGEGAEAAGGEAYPQRIRRGAFLVMGGPVILRPDTVRLVDLTDVGILVLLCEERRRGILPGHEGDSVGGIAHLAEETVTHFPVQLFHRFMQGEPYGAAHQVHFPAVAAVGTDGRCLLQHL